MTAQAVFGQLSFLTSLSATDKRITLAQSVSGTERLSFYSTGAHDYTSTNETDGLNNSLFFADTSGNYNWNFHSNISAASDYGKGFVSGVHGTNGFGLIIDVDGASNKAIKIFENAASPDGDMNLIEIDAATQWQDGSHSGLSFVGDFIECMNQSLKSFRVDYQGRVYCYETAGTKNLSFYHDGTNGVFNASSGYLGLTASGTSGTIFMGGIGNTNNEGILWDFETVANVPLVTSGTGVAEIYFNFGIFAASGFKVGTYSTDNLIDDASNGAGSATLYIGNKSIVTLASDVRLKENIEPTRIDPFFVLSSLNVVDFDWKEERLSKRGRATGLIAQDVYEVFPQVVHKPENESDTWAVEYHHIVPVLIQAVKELNERVKHLEGVLVV